MEDIQLNWETIDGIRYPQLANTSPQQLFALVRRKGEFDAQTTYNQVTTARHLLEGTVKVLEEGNLFIYGTEAQLRDFMEA